MKTGRWFLLTLIAVLGKDILDESGPGTKRTRGWHDPKVTIASKKSGIDAITELGTWRFGM